MRTYTREDVGAAACDTKTIYVSICLHSTNLRVHLFRDLSRRDAGEYVRAYMRAFETEQIFHIE